MKNEQGEWVISRSEECFNGEFYESKEAAIEAAAEELELEPGTGFFVGRVEHLSAPKIDAEDVADRLFEHALEVASEAVYEEVGEVSEGYPHDDVAVGIRTDVCAKIAELLSSAMPTPSFYAVRNVEECVVPVAESAV